MAYSLTFFEKYPQRRSNTHYSITNVPPIEIVSPAYTESIMNAVLEKKQEKNQKESNRSVTGG
jgi:hypothetical protein